MTDRDFFLARRKAELPAFQSVLKALPGDRLDYKPHEKSPSAAQLAWTITQELASASELCDTGQTSFPIAPAPALDVMIATFDRNYAGLVERVARMDDAAWTKVGQLKSGGKVPAIHGPSADTKR